MDTEYNSRFNWNRSAKELKKEEAKHMPWLKGYSMAKQETAPRNKYSKGDSTDRLVQQYFKLHPHHDETGLLKSFEREKRIRAISTYDKDYNAESKFPSYQNYCDAATEVVKHSTQNKKRNDADQGFHYEAVEEQREHGINFSKAVSCLLGTNRPRSHNKIPSMNSLSDNYLRRF